MPRSRRGIALPIGDHVTSLLSSRLVDVISTDQHCSVSDTSWDELLGLVRFLQQAAADDAR